MESFLKAILPCFRFRPVERSIQLPIQGAQHRHFSEKTLFQPAPYDGKKARLSSDEAALSFVSAMYDAHDNTTSLDVTLQSLVHAAGGRTDRLAKRIFETLLKRFIEGKEPINAVMQEAYDRACQKAKELEEFAADHPIATEVFWAVVVLGILVLVAPYAVEWLGFGIDGPIAGE